MAKTTEYSVEITVRKNSNSDYYGDEKGEKVLARISLVSGTLDSLVEKIGKHTALIEEN